jgi:hypothetical protein
MRGRKKEWRMVRLQVATVNQLRTLIEGWVRSEWTGRPTSQQHRWDSHTSIDEVIAELIRRELTIRSRRVKSKQKKAKDGTQSSLAAKGTVTPPEPAS